MHTECPECGQAMYARADKCRCGWKMPAQKSTQRSNGMLDIVYEDLAGDVINLKKLISYHIANKQTALAEGLQKCLATAQKKLDDYVTSMKRAA